MTDIDTARLRELAEAATPGPWEWEGDGLWRHQSPTDYAAIVTADYAPDTGPTVECSDANGAYIAAANPQTVLALLDRIAELERTVAAAGRALREAQERIAVLEAAQPSAEPAGEVVVTRNERGEIVLVSRQDDEGQILSIIAEGPPPAPAVPSEPSEPHSATLRTLEARADQWVKDYEFDSGEGVYRPKEHERMLLLDCILGLIAEVEGDTRFDHPAPSEPSEAMVEAAFVVIYGGPSDYIFDSGNKYGRAGRSAREVALSKVRAALLAAMAKGA